MCFRMKTFQENEQIFLFFLFFFLRSWGDIIFSCVKPSEKKTIRIVFGFFFLENISGEFSFIWKKCERISEEILSHFSMWNWVKKKKSVSLFGRKLMGEFYYAELFLEKKKKNSPRFFPPCKSKWKTGFLEIF